MSRPHVVIVGGGFAGLNTALALRRARASVTLVDRRNFHLFQPLLYQVATGGLSPADITSPLRAILQRQRNTRVIQAEVVDIDPQQRILELADGTLGYDMLILATGARHHYFGREDWAELAPGLKTIEDATRIRSRILSAFEAAEREDSDEARRRLMTFVIVGAGPTGVEMAGAIGELARHTLRKDFRSIEPQSARVVLVEGEKHVLPPYPASLSESARRELGRLGVEVLTGTRVEEVDERGVVLGQPGSTRRIEAGTVLWAAGVQASPLGRCLMRKTGTKCDAAGRVTVRPDCSLPGHPEIFVLGDLASFTHGTEQPLPALASVACQQGSYVGRLIRRRLEGKTGGPFRFVDKGSLAVIGRAAAVADFGRLRLTGYPAWLVWLFVHIMLLVGFENRVLVFVQWAFSYVTRNRGARLITWSRD